MRLLIVNYTMDETSSVLAWHSSVVQELAKHCEKIIVLTESIGKFYCPENVIVQQIPKRPWNIPKILGSRFLMNLTVSNIINKYKIDACFIHMAMEWTYRLFPALAWHHIPILLWYAHGTVTHKLHLAHLCATKVATSTPEGFRIPSQKKIVIGQGINTELFNIPTYSIERNDILYVGRISPRKRILLLIEIMKALKQRAPHLPLRLKLIGPVLSENDQVYLNQIHTEIKKMNLQDQVEVVGEVIQSEIPKYYQNVFLHLNVSQTGSMDKTVLEALACGCPVMTSNEAFHDFLSTYPEFLIRSENIETISLQIIEIFQNIQKYSPQDMRRLITSNHDVQSYALKISKILEGLKV